MPSTQISSSESLANSFQRLASMSVEQQLDKTVTVAEFSARFDYKVQTIFNHLSAGRFPLRTFRIKGRRVMLRSDVDIFADQLSRGEVSLAPLPKPVGRPKLVKIDRPLPSKMYVDRCVKELMTMRIEPEILGQAYENLRAGMPLAMAIGQARKIVWDGDLMTGSVRINGDKVEVAILVGNSADKNESEVPVVPGVRDFLDMREDDEDRSDVDDLLNENVGNTSDDGDLDYSDLDYSGDPLQKFIMNESVLDQKYDWLLSEFNKPVSQLAWFIPKTYKTKNDTKRSARSRQIVFKKKLAEIKAITDKHAPLPAPLSEIYEILDWFMDIARSNGVDPEFKVEAAPIPAGTSLVSKLPRMTIGSWGRVQLELFEKEEVAA